MDALLPLQNKGQQTSPSTPALILAKVSTQNFWLGLVVKLG